MKSKHQIEFDILQRAILNVRNVVNDAKCSKDFNEGYIKGRYDALQAIKTLLSNLEE